VFLVLPGPFFQNKKTSLEKKTPFLWLVKVAPISKGGGGFFWLGWVGWLWGQKSFLLGTNLFSIFLGGNPSCDSFCWEQNKKNKKPKTTNTPPFSWTPPGTKFWFFIFSTVVGAWGVKTNLFSFNYQTFGWVFLPPRCGLFFPFVGRFYLTPSRVLFPLFSFFCCFFKETKNFGFFVLPTQDPVSWEGALVGGFFVFAFKV